MYTVYVYYTETLETNIRILYLFYRNSNVINALIFCEYFLCGKVAYLAIFTHCKMHSVFDQYLISSEKV